VQVAYLHNEHVSHSWVSSMHDMWEYDAAHGDRVARKPLNLRCTTGLIATVRNFAATLFLDKLDHEWLLFVDTDMGFEPDAIHRLLEIADPVERPVVGALCFALMESTYDGMGGHRFTIVPTMYKLGHTVETGHASFCFYGAYPQDTVCQVGATGAAFLLIHRTVLEDIRAAHGDHWFDQMYDEAGVIVGEDFAFCVRAGAIGKTVHVHTGVQTTHHKSLWLSEIDYARQQGPELDESPELNRLRAYVTHLEAQLAVAA
jgi:hypothetical protein